MNRMSAIALVASGLLVVGGATAGAVGLGLFDPAMLKSCEGVLRQRLLAPSQYARVDYRMSSTPISIDDYIRRLAWVGAQPGDADRAIAQYGEPTLFEVVIQFDAPNAFGTPIRQRALCDAVDTSSTFSSSSDTFLRVDEKTHIQWLVSQVRG